MTLPLDTFRAVLGYNPWHFWGWDTSSVRPMSSKCNGVVMEYAWQDADIIGRSEMRREIERAEQRLKNLLGYRPGPEFVETEVLYPKLRDARMSRHADFDARARRIGVYAGEGMIRAVGKMTRALIEPAVALTYSDEDSDGLDDTFTFTTATTVTDPKEIAIYTTAANRTGNTALSERWRILPVQVSISGGNVTVTGKAWMMALPILYEGLLAGGNDPTDAAKYQDEVDLYRVYADADGYTTDDSQSVLVWESLPLPHCASSCCGIVTPSTSDPDAVGYAVARCGIRDARLGYLTPGQAVYDSNALWHEVNWSGCREPDRVILRFQAGAYLEAVDGPSNTGIPGGGIRFDEVITHLAIAGMSRRICSCEEANQEWWRWQFDLSRSAGVNDEQYQISPGDLDNPLGTRAGEVHAWKAIKHLSLPSVAIA